MTDVLHPAQRSPIPNSALASPGARAGAYLIDIVIQVIPIVGFVAGIVNLVMIKDGHIIGLSATGCRIMRSNGDVSGWFHTFVRSAAALLSLLPLGLGFWWAFWDPKRQTWHDKLLNTVVVNDSFEYESRERSNALGSIIAFGFIVPTLIAFAVGLNVFVGHLEEVADRGPSPQEQARGVLKTAQAQQAGGDWHNAIGNYKYAIGQDPGLIAAYQGLGFVSNKVGLYNEAVAAYGKVIEKKPNADAYFGRGLARFSLGSYREAAGDFAEAVRLRSDPVALLSLANAHAAAGDLQAALPLYDRAATVDPKYTAAYLDRGLARLQSGQDGAVTDFQVALRLDPTSTEGAYFLGLTLDNVGEHAAAVANYSRAMRGGGQSVDDRGAARLRRLPQWSERTVPGTSHAVAFSPDGRHLAYGSQGVILAEATSGQVLRTFGSDKGLETIRYSPDGAVVAAFTIEGRVTQWNSVSGQTLSSGFLGGGIWRVAGFSPDLALLATDGRCSTCVAGTTPTASLWDAKSGKVVRGLGNGRSAESVAFSPDGLLLAVGTDIGTVQIFDVKSGVKLRDLPGENTSPSGGRFDRVRTVLFSPDGKLLARVGQEAAINLWAVGTWELVGTLPNITVPSASAVRTLAFSPDGTMILAGLHYPAEAALWDLDGRRRVATLGRDVPGEALSVAFSPAGDAFALAGFADGVRVWTFGVPSNSLDAYGAVLARPTPMPTATPTPTPLPTPTPTPRPTPTPAPPPRFLLAWGGLGRADGRFQGKTAAIAVDSSAGFVYVADLEGGFIHKFLLDGTFVSRWGRRGTGPGEFNPAWGVAVDRSGNVYVLEDTRVQKFTSEGQLLTAWSLGLGSPRGIAIDQNDFIYVIDGYRVRKFEPNGTMVAQWGQRGSGPVYYGNSIAVDREGSILVAYQGSSAESGRILKLGADGRLIAACEGSKGSTGRLENPRGLTVDASGRLYVVGNDRVQVLSSDCQVLSTWGSSGAQPGQFNSPLGVAVDAEGSVFVADALNVRIQKFAKLP